MMSGEALGLAGYNNKIVKFYLIVKVYQSLYR